MKRALALLLAGGLAGSVLAEDMAEAARRERERRQKAKEAGQTAKVVTNDGLLNTKGELANDPNAAPATAPKYRPATTGGVLSGLDAPPSSSSRGFSSSTNASAEDAWRRQAAQARARVEQAQKMYDLWNSQYLAQGEYLVDGKGRTVAATPESLQRKVAAAKADLDAAKKALENLEESARRQSIPPGWLR